MKVAIVGTAPSSVDDAPYDDASWDIWSLGSNATRIKRFSRWFELHTVDVLKAANGIDARREDFFRKIGKSLVVGFENPLFPDATLYPKNEIVKEFGNYFTSSVAYMIALAIYEGAEEIGLWGIDMIGDFEYSRQRACCEYLLGIAKGRGIKVTISEKSPVLRAERMYAFEHHQLSGELVAKLQEAKKALSESQERLINEQRNNAYLEGVANTLMEIARRWG